MIKQMDLLIILLNKVITFFLDIVSKMWVICLLLVNLSSIKLIQEVLSFSMRFTLNWQFLTIA